MPRPPDPDVASRLVERTAELLAAGEQPSLRRVATEAGTTTMSVYTHFGGLPGLMSAVRQEGFTRLGRRLAGVRRTGDPVRDLAATLSAYVASATATPALYLAMFDASVDLADPDSADASLGALVAALARVREEVPDVRLDPEDAALELWAAGHGMLVLVLRGVLPVAALDRLRSLTVTMLAGWGVARPAAEESVRAGWRRRTAPRRERGPAR